MSNTHIDLIVRIKNGYQARNETVQVRRSTFSQHILTLLKKEGYVKNFTVSKDKKEIAVALSYTDGTPAITGVQIVSRPGRKIYQGVSDLPSVLGGLGIAIVSTPKGVYTNKEARRLKIGGEVLYKIW